MHIAKKQSPFLDGVILLLLASFVSFIVYRLFWGLNYKWNWQIIPSYLIYIDPETGNWRINSLLQGLLTTIRISAWAMIIATILGFVTGIMRTSPRLLFRLIGGSYVTVIRNTPPLVLIFIFYYFISDQLFTFFSIDTFFREASPNAQTLLSWFFASPEMLTAFLSGVMTLALFQGAYIGEIVRAGIQSVDLGQWEASSALGLNRFSQLQSIILPQALRSMLPSLANEFINTIKWSSIVSIISIQELTFQGLQVMASTQATLEVWITITIMYLVLCLLLSYVVHRIENRIADPERMDGLTI